MTEPAIATTGTPAGSSERSGANPASLPCVYCREPISADSFAFWTAAKRLLSATCPGCQRRTTVTTMTWRHWTQLSQLGADDARLGLNTPQLVT